MRGRHASRRRCRPQRDGQRLGAGIVAGRGALCQQAAQGEILQVANLLCPGNIAISGSKSACERAVAMATDAGAMRAVPAAPSPGPFTHRSCNPPSSRLPAALAGVPLRKPRIPVVSNVDAQSHDDPEEIRQLLIRQVVNPVRWEDSMRTAPGNGLRPVLRSGTGPSAPRADEAD